MANMSVPYMDMVKNFFAKRPKDVDGVMNTSVAYYKQWLLKKIYARFEFKIPSIWELDYFLSTLFYDGHICITDTAMGVLCLKSGVTGIGVFNQPTTSVIANPVLGNFERTIDVDCVEIRLQYDWLGVGWLIERYAVLLAMCDSSIAVNLMNTKSTYVFGASSKAQAATYQKMYDDITQGKPAVFVSENVASKENMYVMPAKQNFIADDVQLLKRKIVNEFLTDVGINNTNLDKRERLTDDEVNANNEEVRFNIMHWYDNITDGINRANKIFPELNLSCKIRDFKSEVSADEFTSGL